MKNETIFLILYTIFILIAREPIKNFGRKIGRFFKNKFSRNKNKRRKNMYCRDCLYKERCGLAGSFQAEQCCFNCYYNDRCYDMKDGHYCDGFEI